MTNAEKGLKNFREALQKIDEKEKEESAQKSPQPQLPPNAEYDIETVMVDGRAYEVLVARLLINPTRLSQTKKSLILTEANNDDTGWRYRHGESNPSIVFSGMAYISVE